MRISGACQGMYLDTSAHVRACRHIKLALSWRSTRPCFIIDYSGSRRFNHGTAFSFAQAKWLPRQVTRASLPWTRQMTSWPGLKPSRQSSSTWAIGCTTSALAILAFIAPSFLFSGCDVNDRLAIYTTRFGRAPSRDSTPSDYLTPATGSPVPDFPTPQNGNADSAEGTLAHSEQHDGTRVTEAETDGVSEPTRGPDVQAEPAQQEAAAIATAPDSQNMAESGSGAPATPPGQRAATNVDTSARLGSRPTSGSRAPGVVETKVRHMLLVA
jgi:hypothetical protein